MPTEVIHLEVIDGYTFPLINNTAWNAEYPNVIGHVVQVNADSSQAHGGINGRNAGSWGIKGSARRQKWLDALNRANDVIQAAHIAWDDISNYPEVQIGIYPYITRLVTEESRYSFERSIIDSGFLNLFSASQVGEFMHTIAGRSAPIASGASNSAFRGGAMGTLASLTTLYKLLFQSYGTTNLLPYEVGSPLDERKQGLDIEIIEWIANAIEDEIVQRQVMVTRAILFEEGVDIFDSGFTNYTFEDRDISFLSTRPSYKEYFATTFNKDAITFIPILQNFYLTGKYFSNIETAFESTKDRTLDILLTTIRNDDNFRDLPDLTRPAAQEAIAASNGLPPGDGNAARDFILKMLIKTPIDILKGLAELIDPHVAISKLIKTGTGFAFNELASAMDVPAQQINEDLTGEDLLKLVLCIVDAGIQAGEEGLENTTGAEDADYFPRISIDGVDFTGTVAGMFMIPPSPLGLIYLLLELLMNEATDALTNVDGAGAIAAEETECADQQEE